MKKLSLKLDELSVESFETEISSGQGGTVQGHYGTNHDTMKLGQTCNGATDCGTCAPDHTCDGSDGCLGNSLDLQVC